MPSYFGARRSLLSIPPYSGPLTFNPATQSPTSTLPLTFSAGYDTVTDNGANGNPHTVKTYYPKYSGKWVVEFYIISAFISYIGIGTANYDTSQNNGNSNAGLNSTSLGWYSDGSSTIMYYNGTGYSLPYGAYINTTTIGFAYDLTGPNVVVNLWRGGSQIASSNSYVTLWPSSDGAVPLWSDIRTGASAYLRPVAVYGAPGYTSLGPG